VSINQLLYQIKKPYHFVKTGLLKGLVSEIKYQHPSRELKIIAITGTDGKTSTSSLLYHILKTAKKKVALLSTVAAYIGDEKIETGLHVTSPDPVTLNKFMRRLADEKYEYLILEVTSMGEYQYRTWGVKPLIAGLTNIDYEHFDYHLNYQNYLESKADLLNKANLAIINEDDQSALALKKNLRAHQTPFISYSQQDKLHYQTLAAIKKRFPETYNQSNARLALAICEKLEVSASTFKQAVASFPGVKGRIEEVITTPFTVVVDFAHTPQALRAIITALRERLNRQKKPGRLIVLYGTAGLRDKDKRPSMGAAGAELADIVVMTADDPRTESVWSIIRQMKEQLTAGHSKILSIENREDAMKFVLTKLAKPGDIVGLLGKGHEQSLAYANQEIPWDDKVAALKILGKNGKK
jgi:UDP-N-acetylmuramoyl-L-alanyl-D-glutamate--2,6-diaminopimelate ligase